MNRIKDLRAAASMKQSDLARLLSCSPTAISNYETGFRDIDSATICRLCDIFGCTADYLLGRSELKTVDFSEMETSTLLALRRADEHTKDLVRLALEPFWEDASSSAAI